MQDYIPYYCAVVIIHKLILHYLIRHDDFHFYWIQAQDAVRWIERCGVTLGSHTSALDLGCGHGIFGAELMKHGCRVSFSDAKNVLLADVASAPFHPVNIDLDDLTTLGKYDLVICSNVFEHLTQPDRFLDSVHKLLSPQGKLYLSWTNWLSPWGGHEFSPFHYLGARRGYRLYHKFIGRIHNHRPFENLFPTYIGKVLKRIRNTSTLRVVRAAPRYYTELSPLAHIPLLREFLTWNCALLIERKTLAAVP